MQRQITDMFVIKASRLTSQIVTATSDCSGAFCNNRKVNFQNSCSVLKPFEQRHKIRINVVQNQIIYFLELLTSTLSDLLGIRCETNV